MTPLYSKETAEELIYEIKDRLKTHDISYDATAIVRLIENGNEVIGVLTSAEQELKNEGYVGMSIVVNDMIKKIKGEV